MRLTAGCVALAAGAAGLGLVGAAPASADGTVHAYCIWDVDHFGPDGRALGFETYTSDGEGATEEEAIADAKAHAGAPAWDCHIDKAAARAPAQSGTRLVGGGRAGTGQPEAEQSETASSDEAS
ncbi:MAG: hypothetical protein ACRC20_11130 [Segniliparus sp.]|uniref:hypothetical protein n=1 Tax=Segniliparus sp. TaxID=2804064 RepID=UPI003F409741